MHKKVVTISSPSGVARYIPYAVIQYMGELTSKNQFQIIIESNSLLIDHLFNFHILHDSGAIKHRLMHWKHCML